MVHKISISGESITRQVVDVDLDPTPGFIVRVGKNTIDATTQPAASPQLPQTSIVHVETPTDIKHD